MWRYLSEKVVEGNGGNGYSFEVEGCEVADAADIAALIHAPADEVANTMGPFGNQACLRNSSPVATEPSPICFASESRLDVSINRVGSVFVMTPELDRIVPYEDWGAGVAGAFVPMSVASAAPAEAELR